MLTSERLPGARQMDDRTEPLDTFLVSISTSRSSAPLTQRYSVKGLVAAIRATGRATRSCRDDEPKTTR